MAFLIFEQLLAGVSVGINYLGLDMVKVILTEITQLPEQKS